MLRTQLDHIESAAQFESILKDKGQCMICCGRMGPMCVPVYHQMELLRDEYPSVGFYDMEYDIPDARVIRELPECHGFMGLPFTVYFKDGKVVHATSSVKSREQIVSVLDAFFE